LAIKYKKPKQLIKEKDQKKKIQIKSKIGNLQIKENIQMNASAVGIMMRETENM